MAFLISGSIRRVLTILVCLAVLPALLIILYSGLELRAAAIENAKREMLFLARTMGEVQKGITHSTHQILATLGQIKEVHDLDGPGSSAIFRAVVANNPGLINIVGMDNYGEVFASTMPYGKVNLADRQHVRDALAHRKFTAGEYILTRVGPTFPSLAFAYPILGRDGEPMAVLAAAWHLASFSDFLDVANMPPNSFVAVNDRNGIRLFFYPSQEKTNPVGGAISVGAWDKVRGAQGPGVSLHQGSDGVSRIFGYQPVRLEADSEPYIYMWAGIPEAAVLRPANLILARNLILMVLVAGLALAISWLVGGKTLLAPIRRLVGATRAFAEGDVQARSDTGPAPEELRKLAGAFDEMAEALVESQERLRTIADYTYDWEYWLGPDGRPLWVSPSCGKITGYAASEFIADPALFEKIVHPADRVHYDAHLRSVKNGTHTTHIDFRIVHKSGHTVWIDHHCLPLVRIDGTFLGRRVSNRDITDRKRVEGALQESEAQFRSLVEGAPEGIFVQTQHRFVYVNAVGLRLFGARSADALLGTPVLERFHSDSRERISSRIAQLNQHRKPVPRVEHIGLRLDGTPVPVEVSAVPVIFEGQEGALVFIQDISERRQIETRLQQAQKMEAIGALAGGIAHDFNNILFPIIGLSEILLEDLPEGGLDRENVNEILMAARRAGDLVNQILSFSRQSEHKRIPLRIQQVLKEVGKLVRATIPTNIEIHQSLQEKCGPVLADPTNVHQIAMNLITNAYHAVEHNGGAITVGLQQTLLDAADVAGTPLRQGPHALLTVSDTGHGIPAEVLPRIFDPYFTTKAQGKGTGLGLSVVYGIVREHGGDIRVYSEVGQGTSFKVYLPLIPRDMATRPSSPAIPLPTGTERVLLVDDEEPIVRMETQILERLGYRVTPRTSSVEALAAFQANPAGFDLVITDMAMPNMTGAQMARKLVSIRADIPVILCTGFSEQMTIANAGPAEIKGFLMKPLVRSDLAAE
ncbi:MAG: PAS domain S-box protein, partial [Desulfatitalea sp.]|nr:PAS domain S-box protein [Desulfatitalea sp.]